nr:hypothetical protein Iba_chr06dCG8570 [Ipomoea batatas]
MVVAAFGSFSAIPSIVELHCFPANYYVCDCAESSGSPTGISIPTISPRVSINIDVVRVHVHSSQAILAGLKSTIAQMEKVLLEDKELLHSFEVNDGEPDSTPTR